MAVVLFFAGCFYNRLKKVVKSCLPGDIIFDNIQIKYPEKQKCMLKDGMYQNDDLYGNPNIDNGNKFYKPEQG